MSTALQCVCNSLHHQAEAETPLAPAALAALWRARAGRLEGEGVCGAETGHPAENAQMHALVLKSLAGASPKCQVTEMGAKGTVSF